MGVWPRKFSPDSAGAAYGVCREPDHGEPYLVRTHERSIADEWYDLQAEKQRKARQADFVLNVVIWSVLMGIIAGLLLLTGCEPRVPCGVGVMVNSYIHCGPK